MTEAPLDERTSNGPLSARIALLATGVIAAIIAIGALTPSVGPVLPSDKLDHVLAFAGLTMPVTISRPRWAIWVLVGACAYGAAIEFVQPVFGRSADIGDLWADLAGATGGCIVGVAIARALRLRRS